MLKQFLFGLAVFLAAGVAQAQPVAGKEYRELASAQPTDAAGKLEVIEFFWYGCPHCYNFEPVLASWVSKLPKDVQFRRVPAIFNEEWAQAARAYYALEAIGEIPRLHKALFDAVHTGSRLRVANEAALTEWLGKQGVDTKKFAAAYHSFSVDGRIKRAAQLTQAYQIEGVPAIAVNGRYVVITDNIRSLDQLVEVADYLLDKSRKKNVAGPAKTEPKKSRKGAPGPAKTESKNK